jgi:hypothetical protein
VHLDKFWGNFSAYWYFIICTLDFGENSVRFIKETLIISGRQHQKEEKCLLSVLIVFCYFVFKTYIEKELCYGNESCSIFCQRKFVFVKFCSLLGILRCFLPDSNFATSLFLNNLNITQNFPHVFSGFKFFFYFFFRRIPRAAKHYFQYLLLLLS